MVLANLLLVDDEKPFVETMIKRLTKRDLSVVVTFSGQEALERLEEHNNIEVVILDPESSTQAIFSILTH